MKKSVFLIPLIILVLVSMVIYYVFNKPHRKASGEDAAYHLIAEKLFEDYAKDESLANKKYLDKVIEVTGTITKIQTDQNQGIVLILNEGTDIAGISCSLDASSGDRAKNLKKGMEVRLKGICNGGDAMFGVTLNKCEVQ